MYEIGKVYIWQNQIRQFAYLNGTETTVTDDWLWCTDPFTGADVKGWPTDTSMDGTIVCAGLGELRPKDPPKGERSVLDLFKLPELESA